MATRNLFNVNTVEIDVSRFDELIRKEEQLNVLKRLYDTEVGLNSQIIYAVLKPEEESDE